MGIDYYCTTELSPGSIIMNKEVANDDTILLKAQKYVEDATSTTEEPYFESFAYLSGQRIVLSIDPPLSQVMFELVPSSSEACAAYFVDGQCKGKYRSVDKRPVLAMPNKTDCVVSVFAGWAKSFSSGVKRTPLLTFRNEEGDHTTDL
jgi:hypothetical protein